MRTTIDGAGRIVIPKRIRDRLALTGGDELEIEEGDGRIVMRRPQEDAALVSGPSGLLTMPPGPALGPEEVRALLEQSRR